MRQSLRLQKLQNRAARVILSANYDARSADLLESLQWDNLSQRRDKHMALLMCKTHQNKTPNYLRNMFSFANTGSGYDTRQRGRKLALPKPITDYLKKSFQYRGSRLWNSLLYDLRDLNISTKIFQSKVKDPLFGSMMKHYSCLSRQILKLLIVLCISISKIILLIPRLSWKAITL